MRIVKAEWQAAILVCGKCSRRMGGGFGAKERNSLARALRKLGTGKKGRKAGFGIVETGCLKLCPKNAAVAINGAHPQQWHIIARGTDPADAARELGLSVDETGEALPFIP